MPNRRDCEELCLSEAAFPCRSADYNILTLACALSRETRRTQTSAYANSRDHEYLENSCINTEELSCPYKRTDNAYPRYLDTIATRVNDDIDCEKQCTFFQDFVCRSFAFYASASQCFISGNLRPITANFCITFDENLCKSQKSQQCFFSGDDQHSAAAGALQSRPGTDYFERSCESQIPSGEETENLIIDSGTTLGSGQTQVLHIFLNFSNHISQNPDGQSGEAVHLWQAGI